MQLREHAIRISQQLSWLIDMVILFREGVFPVLLLEMWYFDWELLLLLLDYGST